MTMKYKPSKPRLPLKPKGITLAAAANLLHDEDKSKIVEMLLDWAKDDDQLRQRLLLYGASRSGPDAAAFAVRGALAAAIEPGGFIDYRAARSWASEVDVALDAVEHLLKSGNGAEVIEICEFGVHKLLESIQVVDDSDGHFATLRDRVEQIHYDACRQAKPDPVELAKRLFEFELHGDFDVFFGAVERYAKILGTDGLKAYRELAEAEWAKIPAVSGKQESRQGRFQITKIMELLAKMDGDVEQLVAVMGRDLTSAYKYLQIAAVYQEAKQHDNALLWAEKGLKAFPEHTDSRLREFAANEYHRRKRHGDAMAIVWAAFRERPFLETYKELKAHSTKSNAWPEWRERALTEIRDKTEKAKKLAFGKKQESWMRSDTDHSTLVEMFLYERSPDDAWNEAVAGGCSDALWLQLAKIRHDGHPEDVVPIYWRLSEKAVTHGDYEVSVDLLKSAAGAMKRLGRSAEFVSQLEPFRLKYKIKRNFAKLIEANRKSLYG